MAEEDVVKYAVNNQVATITLNRPEKYNTLRGDIITGLEGALKRANQDEAVKVIILEGAGDAFCAGFDFSGEGYGRGRRSTASSTENTAVLAPTPSANVRTTRAAKRVFFASIIHLPVLLMVMVGEAFVRVVVLR